MLYLQLTHCPNLKNNNTILTVTMTGFTYIIYICNVIN